MRNLKKLASIVLAAVMTLALAVPAFAAQGPATTGSITIANTLKDAEYDIYRIFDATVKTTEDPAKPLVSYSISEKWANFFAAGAPGATYIVDDNNAAETLNPITVDSAAKYINITDDNVVAFADAALNYALANNIQVDKQIIGDGEDVTESNMPFGYYMTYMQGSSEQTIDSNGSICSLTPVSKDVTLKIKATTPTIEKTSNNEKEVDADVGTTVPFTVTGKVPDAGNFQTYIYEVSDTMSEGLTFNENVTVTIGSTTFAPSDEQLVYANNGFTLKIPVKDYQDQIGAAIVINYSATVNKNAVAKDDVKNTAILKYSNDPSNGETTVEAPPEIVDVYTSKIVINKTDSADKPLAGATFVLMNEADKYYSVGTDGVVTWVDTEEAATKVTSGENGVVEFAGLADGTYSLVETEAPAGYNKLAEAVPIAVDGTKKDYKLEGDNPAPWVEGEDSPESKQVGQMRFLTVTKPVVNLTGAELPETGGMGTTLFYVVGGLLVVGAGILLITKKRMGAE